MKRYNPIELEPKWQQIWRDERRYAAADQSDKPKYYVTGMFPYPSGAGMHTGHFFEHSIVDAVARFRRTLGYNVMYPMGFDNFGLPAENYAIKTGRTPQETTAENIASFTNQLRRIGASIDWDREVRTSDPEYYRWTQWIFTQLFERGLAYQKEANQWWCPKDKTVLANEQVISGRCWRCEELVVKKPMKQWFFKITDYADSLLAEIPALDWPDKIKTAQENWIGRSQGAEIEFVVARDTLAPSSLEAVSRQVSVEHAPAGARAADVSEDKMSNSRDFITVFTTRPDTIFGATFLVLAPEHPLVSRLVTDDTREAVEGYVAEAIKKSEIERSSEGKDKTGVFTGSYAINPASGERMPIWVADYVLWGYGTGAIMAVPAHDERDFSFAVKFDLPIIRVVTEDFGERLEDAQTVSGSVVIVYDDATKKFLGVKTGTSDGIWLNGGGREEGESFEQTAIRELREETGFATYKEIHELGEPVFSYYFNDVKKMAKRSFGQGFLFVVDATDQAEAAPEEHEKSFEFGWYDYDDLIAGVKDVGGGVEHWLEMLTRAKKIIDGEEIDRCYHGEGTLINSGVFDGIATSDAREQIVAWLEQENRGRAKVTYKMRDWLISRQRYWGAPIPIIHCNEHGAVAVPADQLPVLLPEVSDFVPRGDGKSVLGAQEDWVNTACPTCGKPAKRETDTMDGYACSSWYLLRYTDPHNDAQAWSPEIANYWAPLDMYVGGDHAVAHLLYVRFWTHVFHDMGLVDFKEPVKKLVYHGLIQAEDGRKMSKSLGNVVDPLEVIDAGYGADALRTFELFLGPIDENSSWNSRGIAGVYRFLNRVWTLTQEYIESADSPPENRKRLRAASQIDSSSLETRAADVSSSPEATLLASLTHVAIKKVTDDINRLSFNTAIAAMMELVNELYKLKLQGFSADWQFTIESLVQLLQPFAPHMSAELWQQLGHDTPLDTESWPAWDDTKIVQDTMTIIVQVNGKLRAKLEVAPDETEATIKKLALADENVQKFVTSEPRKVIYVKGKLVSVVV